MEDLARLVLLYLSISLDTWIGSRIRVIVTSGLSILAGMVVGTLIDYTVFSLQRIGSNMAATFMIATFIEKVYRPVNSNLQGPERSGADKSSRVTRRASAVGRPADRERQTVESSLKIAWRAMWQRRQLFFAAVLGGAVLGQLGRAAVFLGRASREEWWPAAALGAFAGGLVAVAWVFAHSVVSRVRVSEVTLKVGIGDVKVALDPDSRQQLWRFFIEMTSRIATRDLAPGDGLLEEALTSLTPCSSVLEQTSAPARRALRRRRAPCRRMFMSSTS
jgi:hypothetical protein